MDHTSVRRHGAAFIVASLVAALVGVVAAPAAADRGGPVAPGWHWVDSTEVDGPPVSDVSVSNLGEYLPQARGDDSIQAVTASFPVTLDGVTGTALQVSSNGFVAVSDGVRTVSLRALSADMLTNRVWMRTIGDPGSRQLVIQWDEMTRYAQAGGPASVTVTFVEGESGGLVTFRSIDTPWDATVGLHEGLPIGSAPSILAYTGAIESGRSVLFTDAADSELPTLLEPVDDPRGYRQVAGQPTGAADLRGSGRVVLPTSDSGSRTLTIPFPFTFDGAEQTELTVGSDANFRFGTGSLPAPGSTNFPDASFPDSGGVFLADLVAGISTQVRGTAPQRQFVIQWLGQRYGDASPEAAIDASLVLFEDGSDLGFVYADVPTGVQPFIGLNYDALARQRRLTPVANGDAILWSTLPGATQAVEQPPLGGTGTDAFGYRAVPAPYDFIDASDGTAHMVGADDAVVSIPTPFPVSLYGTDAATVSVSSNGFLTVGGTAPTGGATTLPSASFPGLVQPYQADLIANPGVFTKTVGSAPHRRFVVMWDAHAYGNVGRTTRYEVVFAEDSTDVLVQYDQIDQVSTAVAGLAGINKGDGETRLQLSATAQDIADDSAVRYTTDRLLGLSAPASIKPEGVPAALENRVQNLAETSLGAIRQEVRLDGIAGLEAADVTLEAFHDATWTELALTESGGVLGATVAPSDGASFGPGVDRSVPLRISVAPGSPLGDLQIGTTLVRLVDGSPAGRIATATTTTSLVETVPNAPTEVVATPGEASAEVTWTAPSNGGREITGYTVTATPGGAQEQVGAGETSASFSGLSNGTAYTFAVVATNDLGDSEPGISTPVTPFGLPGVPGGVSAVAGNAQATVSWTAAGANGSAVTGYTVTASPGGATATVDGDETQATVAGLSNGTAYTFTVLATNAAGDGAASAPSTAVTPFGPPGAPGGVSAVAGNQQATVSWTAAGANGSVVTGYTVTASPGGASATVDGDETQASVAGLTNGTAYTFTVLATNAAGDGATSAPSAAVTPFGLPGAPSGVSASGGDQQATVSWTAAGANGSAVTGYTVTASPGGATATVDGDETQATVTGLTNGTAYTFTVVATNAAGDGAASAPSTAVTPFGLPGAPGGVSAVAGNAQATVSWTAAGANGSAVTGYTVTASPGGATATVDGDETQATVTGLTNGTAYTFTVVATNAAGDGAASAPSTAVTPQAPQVTVKVRSALKPASIKKGKTTKVYGTLTPSPSSGKVFLERQAGARWVPAGTAVLKLQTLPDRRRVIGYVFTVKGTATGRFSYRVVFRGSTGFRAATGPVHKLTVK